MNRLYLILLPITTDREAVIKYLETNRNISFWFYTFPSSIFVRSSLTARQLQDIIVRGFNVDRILVVHINQSSDFSGLVPNNHVELFNNL